MIQSEWERCRAEGAPFLHVTLSGRLLAAFLRGLLPETRQFDREIARIEAEAGALSAERIAGAMQEAGIRSGPRYATLEEAAVALASILGRP